MKIGLFFGSFNPIHQGHLIIAHYTRQKAQLDQLWFVVSPQNPFKNKKNLLNEHDRLHLVELAIENYEGLHASNIEFNLPKPSYTIDTLTHLKDKYPQHEFTILMGGDNLQYLHKWKNYEQILEYHQIIVYQRPGSIANNELTTNQLNKIQVLDVPQMDISASFIRAAIKNDALDMRGFLNDKVWAYIDQMNLYR